MGLLLKVMLPFYFKVLSMQYSMECEIDDLNFQLLSLIGNYRISNIIGKLRTKQARKADQRTQILRLNQVEFLGWLRGVIYSVGCFWIICFFMLGFLFDKFPQLNFLNFSQNLRLYSNVIWFRFAYLSILLPGKICDTMKFFFDMVLLVEYLNSNVPNHKAPKAGLLDHTNNKLITTLNSNSESELVVFRNVSLTLGYQPVLKKINLRFLKGHTIGIFGIEGGGRSTIFELLTRVFERDKPTASSIHLFGQPIEEIDDETIHKHIFWIEKDPVLLEGNVRENIDPYGEHSVESIKKKLTSLGFLACMNKQRVGSQGQESARMANSKNKHQDTDLVGNKVPNLQILESKIKSGKIL
jgi:ABC-type multidrug transport system fused ATPase/permease subunit